MRQGPESDSGGITTFTREPSASRASQSGDASSTRRPSGARIRSIACISSASESKRTPVRSSRPRRSTYTSSGPFTITSSTAGSDSSGSSGPSPVASSSTRRQSASRSASGSAPASRSTSARTSASSPAVPLSPDARPLDQPPAQRDREVVQRLHRWRSPKSERLSPMDLTLLNLDSPTETRTFDRGRFELYRSGR